MTKQSNPQDPWEALERLVERREELEAQMQLTELRIEAFVRHLVLVDHASWADIGGILGISRQSAHQRYQVKIYGVPGRFKL